MSVFLVAVIAAYILVIWLKTDAFAEYLNLITLGSGTFFHLGDYRKVKKDGYDGNYVEFMLEYYKDVFFVRLMSCPICLSTWLGLVGLFIWLPALDGLFLAPLTLFLYLVYVRLM